MKKWHGIALLAIIVALLVWNVFGYNSGNVNKQKVVSLQSQLNQTQVTVNSQAIEIADLKCRLAACQTANSGMSGTVIASPAPVYRTPKSYVAPVARQQAAPAPVQERTVIRAEEPVVNTVEEVNTLPSYFYEVGTKGVKFCVRLGGSEKRHLPHLAITSGMLNTESNGISGYNWVVLGPVSDLVGDWGVTRDGTFFVSVKMIDSFLTTEDDGIVELKAPATSWVAKPMTRFGDYYIYRAK